MDVSMIQEIIELKKLIASEGTILTNGQAYGTEVYLGKNDIADNWYEILLDEYEQIKAEVEAEIEEG